jgi:TolA-binding protein
LPADLFLDLLDLGEGHVALHWARFRDAIALFQRVAARQPSSAWAAEAIYWWGVAVYLATRSREQLDGVWEHLRVRFPESIWAARTRHA